MATILVTGGCGYIGSHTCVELINSGYDVIVLDNLYNSKEVVLDRIKMITGIRPKFYKVDILDREGLNKVFDKIYEMTPYYNNKVAISLYASNGDLIKSLIVVK